MKVEDIDFKRWMGTPELRRLKTLGAVLHLFDAFYDEYGNMPAEEFLEVNPFEGKTISELTAIFLWAKKDLGELSGCFDESTKSFEWATAIADKSYMDFCRRTFPKTFHPLED